MFQPSEMGRIRRSEDPEELKAFCKKRDAYISRSKVPIRDYMEISPMVPCDRWFQNYNSPPPWYHVID